MTTGSGSLSRRTVLHGAAGLLGVGAIGSLAGGATTRRVAVGYDGSSGRQAVLDVADAVIYDYSFPAVAIEAPRQAVGPLANRDDIRYIEDPVRYEAIAQTIPWGIDRIDADVVHGTDSSTDTDDDPETGAGADVAIIDTGIDRTHSDLAANLGEGQTFLSGTQTPEQQDDNGHGTACAGVVAAVDNDQGVVGTSPGATLHGIKAMNAAGLGLSFDIAAAIDYVAQQGYDVASMSFGGSESSQVTKEACVTANDEGVLLIAAAGNSGPCSDCVAYPAAYETVIAVSATTQNDKLANFSSTGPEVDLAAPGVAIYTSFLGGTYIRLDGTSFSCPHVSGVGALLMANGFTNEEARSQLTQTAETLTGLSSTEQGEGLVDAAAALNVDSSDDLDGSDENQSDSVDDSDSSGSTGSDGDSSGGGTDSGEGGERSDGRSDDANDNRNDGNGGDGTSGADASVESDEDGVGISAGVTW